MFFFFKQKTAYEMRISDWSSDVCSSDLWRDSSGGECGRAHACRTGLARADRNLCAQAWHGCRTVSSRSANGGWERRTSGVRPGKPIHRKHNSKGGALKGSLRRPYSETCLARSEEHTSELQSLMRISYAVFCLKKKKIPTQNYQYSPEYTYRLTT